MFKQKIFIISFIVLIFVAIFNYIGIKYNLYWIYKWYDIPMHMLGGLWVSLFFLSLYPYLSEKISIIQYQTKPLFMVFFVLLFVTFSWEIFELVGKITFLNDSGYWQDTLGDILNGYVGGWFGYLLFIKMNNVELISDTNQIIK